MLGILSRASALVLKVARRTGLVDYVRSAAQRDTKDALKPVHHDVRKLQHQLDAVQRQLRDTLATLAAFTEQAARAERIGLQAKSMLRLDEAHRDLVAQLDTVLDEPRIIAHVEQAIAAAPLQTDP